MPRSQNHLSRTVLLGCLAFAAPAHAHAQTSPQGIWLDNDGRGAVEIKPCGSKLCGHVVWVKSSADAKGCGRQIIGDATPAGSKGTHTGWIYSPQDRKRYNVEITPAKDGRLKVVGYAGIRLFSRTMYWTRADEGLQRCGTGEGDTASVPKPPSVRDDAVAVAEPAKQSVAASAAAVAPARAAKVAAAAPAANEAARPAAPSAPSAKASTGDTEPTSEPALKNEKRADAEPEAEAGEDGDGDGASKPGLGDLAGVLDKVIKRTPGGGCKLDLPWVKVQFECETD